MMIEEDRQAARCASDRVVGEREGLPCASISVVRVLCGKGFLSLDAAFRAHLFLTFFQRRDSESVPAVVAAYSGIWRLQRPGPLSRLLVLDNAWAAVHVAASVETKSPPLPPTQICPQYPHNDTNHPRQH